TQERAQRARDATVATDHLADVVRRDVQDEDERVVALLLLDANRRRIVDELAREVREQSRHYFSIPEILISFATASVGCAPFASQSLTFASSRSMVDRSRCGL